jgi:chlorite dismutase
VPAGFGGRPAPETTVEVPETREGWYVLHDCYAVDWKALAALPASERAALLAALNDWLIHASGAQRGGSAGYIVSGQKADVMFLHYRSSPGELNEVRRDLLRSAAAAILIPVYGYLSVIEVSLYEATALAHRALAEAGIRHGSTEFEGALRAEMERQTAHLDTRLWRGIPDKRYVCFYPMSKRRGETDNWYMLPIDERRGLMRSHGRLGHKFHQQVTQVIGGSTGLDDWEWSVDLHADDPLVFKKLVYEMRFDPASARFAEFGPFYVGRAVSSDQLIAHLSGS